VRLQWATEAGDAEFWITQVVAQCVPDGRTNHGEQPIADGKELSPKGRVTDCKVRMRAGRQ